MGVEHCLVPNSFLPPPSFGATSAIFGYNCVEVFGQSLEVFRGLFGSEATSDRVIELAAKSLHILAVLSAVIADKVVGNLTFAAFAVSVNRVLTMMRTWNERAGQNSVVTHALACIGKQS
eukprot:235760-Amphidinium_carterae.1